MLDILIWEEEKNKQKYDIASIDRVYNLSIDYNKSVAYAANIY